MTLTCGMQYLSIKNDQSETNFRIDFTLLEQKSKNKLEKYHF